MKQGSHGKNTKKDYTLEIAIVYGATLAVLTHCLKHITGAHFNPAITIACAITRRVSFLRALCYVISQCGGSVVGVLLLRHLVPNPLNTLVPNPLAATRLSLDVSIVTGMVLEMLFSLVYSLLYFTSVCTLNGRLTQKRSWRQRENGALLLGVFYGTSHLVLLDRTGCGLNPARSLGPVLVDQKMGDLWLYVTAPTLACCFSVLMWDLVLRKVQDTPQPQHRPRSLSLLCCKPSHEEIILRENQTHAVYGESYGTRKDEASV